MLSARWSYYPGQAGAVTWFELAEAEHERRRSRLSRWLPLTGQPAGREGRASAYLSAASSAALMAG